jgi:hypothetical protein
MTRLGVAEKPEWPSSVTVINATPPHSYKALFCGAQGRGVAQHFKDVRQRSNAAAGNNNVPVILGANVVITE